MARRITVVISQSTVQTQIQRELLTNHGISTTDRRVATEVARSLQSQLFFCDVEWGGRVLTDGVDDLYMFLGDQEGGSGSPIQMQGLPTGVVTYLTKCYSPCCRDGRPCYAYSCPGQVSMLQCPRCDNLLREVILAAMCIALAGTYYQGTSPTNGTLPLSTLLAPE